MIDLDSITIGQLETLENIGVDIAEFEDEKPTARAMLAMAWLIKNQEDPNYTLDDARRMTMSEVDALVADVDLDEIEAKAAELGKGKTPAQQT